jgi:hypothetical protein
MCSGLEASTIKARTRSVPWTGGDWVQFTACSSDGCSLLVVGPVDAALIPDVMVLADFCAWCWDSIKCFAWSYVPLIR